LQRGLPSVLDHPQPNRERAVTSSTDILERPDVRDADTDKPNEMFHYVRKNKIAESAVMGTLVEALCGEVFPVTKTAKPGSPVCPRCKEIYETLRK
jgi:type II secretory pathway component PulC